MSRSHLTIDFPIKAPASVKALNEELPPLMPELAKAHDHLGTVHYSHPAQTKQVDAPHDSALHRTASRLRFNAAGGSGV